MKQSELVVIDDNNQKDYIVYMNKNNQEVYASLYNPNNINDDFQPIETQEEFDMLNKLLKEMNSFK